MPLVKNQGMGGKKDKSGGLGRALVRKHNQMVQQSKEKGHALRLQQRKVLESVTEISDLDAVVEQAEEAALLYSAENPAPTLRVDLDGAGVTKEETKRLQKEEEALYASSLRVPRRPPWNSKMSPEELDVKEKQTFLVWRRSLARVVDPEQDATDGNTGEARRELPVVPARAELPTGGSSANIDTFTQMMVAVTQLIQHSHDQLQSNSRDESSVDKLLKLFQDMRPPDGNTGEAKRELPVVPARAEPPTGGSSATIDTFTQMMAAVTQLIQHSHDQLQSNSRGESSVDKIMKLFQDMRPPLYTGAGELVDAENWLMRIEKILEAMHCPLDRRVSLATFALDGEAKRWWQGQLQEKFSDRSVSQITWEEFIRVFRERFMPLSAIRQMQDRFVQLVQGNRTVMQYETEFTMLSRYAAQLIPNAEEKCHRFLSGLRDMIRRPLIPFGLDDYSVLVERARRIEIDFQATQKRRDFQKRKNFEKSRSFQTLSEGSSVKKTRSDSSRSFSSAGACEKCGKIHRGECLFGSNICFWCYQPGHMSRNCPKGRREVKYSAPLSQ